MLDKFFLPQAEDQSLLIDIGYKVHRALGAAQKARPPHDDDIAGRGIEVYRIGTRAVGA